MSPKILITGGAGFIGSTVADLFVASGWEVAVLDDLSSGKRENVPAAARFYQADVRQAATIALVASLAPEIICHHAAQIDVRRSMSDPQLDCAVNLAGLLNVMEGARQAGSVRHIVFASSGGATYGDTQQIPTPEEHPARPMSNYGVAKAASELYLGVYRANYGISSTALRYSNVYGPRQDPHGEAGVVAIFCGRLLAGEPCTIYGDGCQTRDYVFVEDVARANFLAASQRYDGPLNIGTGVETDVKQLYAHLAHAAGSTAAALHAKGRPGEQLRSCIDPRVAAATLGWLPQMALKDGLARTLAWFEQQRQATRK
jgi:UDP-glucose 4-epimerase